jgi:3-methyladenine DNA glycosylase AlkD
MKIKVSKRYPEVTLWEKLFPCQVGGSSKARPIITPGAGCILQIGLTQLRKLGRKVGRDRKLARQLWDSNVYDAKVIGLLIDEPKMIARKQAERQVEQ